MTQTGPILLRNEEPVSLDLTPVEAIQRYGVPDQVQTAGPRSYWVYQRSDGYFYNLLNYFSFGKVHRSAVQLEYEGERLIRVEEYPSGGAFGVGILSQAPPGMAAE